MAVFWKLAYRNNSNLNGFDYVLVRSATMMILSTIQAIFYRINIFEIKEGFRWKLYSFAIIGAIGVPTYFVGLKYVPTSIASLIYSISPMIVAVIAPFVLNEVLTKSKALFVIGSFIGASMFTLHKNVIPQEADYYYLGMLLIFFTWWTGSTIAILMRMINKHIHFAMCPVYFGFATVGVSLAIMLVSPSSFNFSYN